MNQQALGDGWIPVTERLPEEGQEVNAFDGISVLQSEYLNGFFRASNQDSHRYFSITHWMPLPLPPNK